MKTVSMQALLLSLAVLALTRCGPMPQTATVAVADHADALTTGAGDNLFTLTLSEATKDFPIADISVNAGLPGQTATVVNFTHNDLNGDGKLNKGESLSCKEPIVNLFDATTVGKPVKVDLAEKENGTFFVIGGATWTPAN
jgi:hypothetical protein